MCLLSDQSDYYFEYLLLYRVANEVWCVVDLDERKLKDERYVCDVRRCF